MSIICGCGRKVETQPEWAGQWITCPGCAGALYSPYPGPKPSAPTIPDVPVAAPAATRLCPLCAETIPADDPTCRFCSGPRPVVPPRPAPAASSGDGGVAALVVSLLGYMFCGLLCPIGWYLGSKHEADCRRRGVEPSGTGKAGKIIGIVGTIFLILGFGGFVLCLAVGG
jgi:hypothetical protein